MRGVRLMYDGTVLLVCARGVLGLFGVVACTLPGCTLPEFAPDDRPCPCAIGYVCNPATNLCQASDGGTTGAGGAVATTQSTSVSGSTSSAATASSSSGGGMAPSLPPLVVTSNTDEAQFEVQGSFRLETTAGVRYQLQRWYDATAVPAGYAADGTPRVFYQHAVEHENDRMEMADATLLGHEIVDESPVRATVVAHLKLLDIVDVDTSSTIYASGRVATSFRGVNAAGMLLTLGGQVHFMVVNGSFAWTLDAPPGEGWLTFTRNDGDVPMKALFFNRSMAGAQEPLFAGSSAYDLGLFDISAGEVYQYFGEIQLGISGATTDVVAERVADARAPASLATTNAIFDGTGFDPLSGAFVMRALAAGSPIDCTIDAALPRFSPAFEIRDWTAPTFTITRGGVVEATSDDPIGPRVIARLDTTAQKVVFVYVPSIAAGAPESERSFRVEP